MNPMTKAGDGSEDLVCGLCPDEGLWGGVVVIDVLFDCVLQFPGAAEDAAAQLLLGQRRGTSAPPG